MLHLGSISRLVLESRLRRVVGRAAVYELLLDALGSRVQPRAAEHFREREITWGETARQNVSW